MNEAEHLDFFVETAPTADGPWTPLGEPARFRLPQDPPSRYFRARVAPIIAKPLGEHPRSVADRMSEELRQ